jgi:phosphotransferase system enzyme I (PtsI)
MTTLRGKGVSKGIALGRLVFLKSAALRIEKKAVEDPARELERFQEACKTAAGELRDLAAAAVEKIGEKNALVFDIHRMMLEDSDFRDPIVKIIGEEGLCAEYAVKEAGEHLAQDFADMDDDYMRERAADIRDVTNRLISILSGTPRGLDSVTEPVILAAPDFSPSETAQFDRSKVLALVSQMGAAHSHTAIFARTMGIPAVIALGSGLSPELGGQFAALDGETGELCVSPDPQTRGEFEKKRQDFLGNQRGLENFRGKPTLSKGGQRIKLYANIGSAADAEAALAGDAEGIGLFRTEFLYLGRNDYPGEDIQYESYRKVLEQMGERQVIIRTLDIGADKQASYFKLPPEENPALGMRAIRICLTRPALFRTQLRAIYRASAHGNAAVMFPMISTLAELRQAKTLAREVREELTAEGIPFKAETPVGIMIETPASAIISDLLAPEADFFSIGTNDLTQYTLAVDRQNDAISAFCDIHHESILRLIRMTVENAHRAGIWAGICGSLGADQALTKTFLEMGLDELSVEPASVLPLRRHIAAL